jgi:hypothetical protein
LRVGAVVEKVLAKAGNLWIVGKLLEMLLPGKDPKGDKEYWWTPCPPVLGLFASAHVRRRTDKCPNNNMEMTFGVRHGSPCEQPFGCAMIGSALINGQVAAKWR